MPVLNTTVTAMGSGIAAVTGTGSKYLITVTGTWAQGDSVALLLTNVRSALVETIGFGEVSGKEPVFSLTFKKKLYALYESIAAISAIDDPVTFNDLNAIGNGTLNVANELGTTEDLTAAAVYQNKLVLFSPNLIQIWTVNADANLYEQGQSFENIGTSAAKTVKAMGTLDVMFLANSGVRSLRARESSLDADTIDIGTPIDALIEAEINAGAEEANAVAVVDPMSKRYWMFLDSVLYVLSYFRGSKITAWTTYTMSHEVDLNAGLSYTDGFCTVTGLIPGNEYVWDRLAELSGLTNGTQGLVASATFVAQGTTVVLNSGTILNQDPVASTLIGQKSFVPNVLEASNDQVYCRSEDDVIYSYGGADGNTYDNVQARLETPWLDDNSPMKLKGTQAIDVGITGKWLIKVGANPASGEVVQVLENGSLVTPNANIDSTFDLLRFAVELFGSHFKISASSSSSLREVAKLSEIHLLYQDRETS